MLPMFLSAPRAKAAAAAIAAVTASMVFTGTGSQASADDCAPEAYTPGVGGGSGIALANLPCYGTYTIKLVNNAGNTLDIDSDTDSGGVQTPGTTCAGAIVHTFIYVNVNGVGMSDTSGTTPC